MALSFFGRNKIEKGGNSRLPFALRESIQVEYQGRYYSGQVQSLEADGLWVTWTSFDGAAVRPGETESVTLFSSNRAEGDRFSARIVENSGARLSHLRIVSKVDQGVVHRRKYVRIPYQFPVHFQRLDAPGGKWVKTHTHDLSGGGVRAYVSPWDRPSPGEMLELELEMPKSALIRATAEVAWTGPAGSSATVFEMGLRFVEVREEDRELIFRRVFDRQVELHRSGLI